MSLRKICYGTPRLMSILDDYSQTNGDDLQFGSVRLFVKAIL